MDHVPDVLEQTLALVKPDGVHRKLVGRIISRYEDKGLRVVHLQMMQMTKEQASQFYCEHEGENYFLDLISFMTSGRIVALVLEGKAAVSVVRRLNGPTSSAPPGTIRGDFAKSGSRNVVHGSDSVENAIREIGILFSPSEISCWIAEGG